MKKKLFKIILVISIVITTFLIGATLLFPQYSKNVLENAKYKRGIIIYFMVGAKDSDVLEYKNQLIALCPSLEKDSIELVPADKVLEEFKERHKDDEMTIQALKELDDNPLRARLDISTKTEKEYKEVINSLIKQEQPDIVDKISHMENVLGYLVSKASLYDIKMRLYATTIIFISISFLLILFYKILNINKKEKLTVL